MARPRTEDSNGEPPSRSSEEDAGSDGPDVARIYLRRIGVAPLLGREAEVALAKRIEEAEHRILGTLVQIPALRVELARMRTELRVRLASDDAEELGPDGSPGRLARLE